MSLITNGTSQSHIQAVGDVAGRDVIKTTQHIHNTRPSAKQLTALGLKYLQEKQSNQQISYIIERLSLYHSVAEEESTQVIGLAQKLNDGGYQHYLNFAMRAKELFAKHLYRHQFSESAQKMYAFMLAKVYTCFQQQIYPMILMGSNKEDIMDSIRIKINYEIEDALGENVLELYDEEIAGMVYYLTGNCHIKWI